MANKQRVLRPGKNKASLDFYVGPILPGPDTRDQKAAVPSLGPGAKAGGKSRGNKDEGDGKY